MIRMLRAHAYRLIHSRSWWILVAGLALYALEGSTLFASGWRSEGIAVLAEAACRAEVFELVMVFLPIWFAWFFGSDLTNRTLRNVLVDTRGRSSYALAAALLVFGSIVAVMVVCGTLLMLNLLRLEFALDLDGLFASLQRMVLLTFFATAYALVATAVALTASKNAAFLGIAAAALLSSTVLLAFFHAVFFSLPAPAGPVIDGVLTTCTLSGMFTMLEETGVVQPWWFAQTAAIAALAVLAAALILRRKELR